MRLITFGILVGAMLSIEAVYAADYSPMTEQEARQLPSYCMLKYRERNSDPTARSEGFALIGPQYSNVHHFCDGLNFLNRYYRSMGQRGAGSYLGFAISEFNYSVDHIHPQSPIGADILLNRGIAHALSNNNSKAMSDLHRALSLDPKMARAYVTLADEYIKLKNRNKALEVVTEGLRNVPDSKALKRRYDELGGKQPYPDPIVAAPPAVPSEAVPLEKPETQVAAPQPRESGAVAEETSSQAVGQPGTDTQPIGTPKNPYCRFCPD